MTVRVKTGITRVVFIFDKFVIKVPKFKFGKYCQYNFLKGCIANLSERKFCKLFKDFPTYDLVAPSYWCSWFGFILIQARCNKTLERELNFQELQIFQNVCSDLKPENFGYYKGNLVCLDYGD